MLRPPEGYYVPVRKIRCAWVWHRCAHCGSRMQWEPSYQVSTSLSLAYPSQHDKEHRIIRSFYLPTRQDLCLGCAERVLGPDPTRLKPEELEARVEGFFNLTPPSVVTEEVGSASPIPNLSLGKARKAGVGSLTRE